MGIPQRIPIAVVRAGVAGCSGDWCERARERKPRCESTPYTRPESGLSGSRGNCWPEAASQSNSGVSDYSGSAGRWTELSLYRTAKGSLIDAHGDRTAWAGERDTVTVERGDQEEIIEFFGLDWLATDLYQAAGIDTAQDIEE